MVSKSITLTLILTSLVLSVPQVSASNKAPQKLTRGAINLFSAPVEIPREVRAHWISGSEKTHHIIVWIFCGFVKGIAMTTARSGSGLWDILTFPVPIPAQFDSLIKPASVFDDWPQRQAGVQYKNLHKNDHR